MAVFDAQIGGLAFPETLWLAIWPLAVQLPILALVLARKPLPSPSSEAARPAGQRWPWGYLLVTALGVSLAPLALIFVQSLTGWASLTTNFVLTHEIGASVI